MSLPDKFIAQTDVGIFQIKITNAGEVINIGSTTYCVQITHDNKTNSANLAWLGTENGGCEHSGKSIHGSDTVTMVDLGFTILKQLYPGINPLVDLKDSSKFTCKLPNGAKESISNMMYNLLITGQTYYQRKFGANVKYPGTKLAYDKFVEIRNDPSYFDKEYDFNNNDLNTMLRPMMYESKSWADFFTKLYAKYGRDSCMYAYPWINRLYGYLTQNGAIHVDWTIDINNRPIINYTITKTLNNAKNKTRKTYEYNPFIWGGGVRSMSYKKKRNSFTRRRLQAKYSYYLYPNKHKDDMKKMLDRRSNWVQSTDKMRQLQRNNWNLFWKLTDNFKISDKPGGPDKEYELYFYNPQGSPASVLRNQIVNHVPFSHLITQKYNLINTLGSYYSKCKKQLFDVVPETIIISKDTNPDEIHLEKDAMYIVKPEDAFAGLGISIFNDKAKLLKYINDGLEGKLVIDNYTKVTADPEKQMLKFGPDDKWIVQKYIINPLLLEGRKFDIRVNVLVNNDFDIYFSPYIIVRTSSLPYTTTLTGDDIIDKATHITNNAFQRQIPKFYGKYEESNILRLKQLQQYFDLSYGSDKINVVRDFFPKMKELVRDAILSIREKVASGRTERRFYEHFGFDFLIDADFHTWLIEVNQNPSMDWLTEWSDKYTDFFLEEVARKAIDPYFPSKHIRSVPGKFPTTPDLPWAGEVTKKDLPSKFKPVVGGTRAKSDDTIFELIYSETKKVADRFRPICNKE